MCFHCSANRAGHPEFPQPHQFFLGRSCDINYVAWPTMHVAPKQAPQALMTDHRFLEAGAAVLGGSLVFATALARGQCQGRRGEVTWVEEQATCLPALRKHLRSRRTRASAFTSPALLTQDTGFRAAFSSSGLGSQVQRKWLQGCVCWRRPGNPCVRLPSVNHGPHAQALPRRHGCIVTFFSSSGLQTCNVYSGYRNFVDNHINLYIVLGMLGCSHLSIKKTILDTKKKNQVK